MKNRGGGGGGQINFRLAFVNLLVCGLHPFDIAYSACHVPMLEEGPLGTRSHQPAGDIQFLGSSEYFTQNLVWVWCCICGAIWMTLFIRIEQEVPLRAHTCSWAASHLELVGYVPGRLLGIFALQRNPQGPPLFVIWACRTLDISSAASAILLV